MEGIERSRLHRVENERCQFVRNRMERSWYIGVSQKRACVERQKELLQYPRRT